MWSKVRGVAEREAEVGSSKEWLPCWLYGREEGAMTVVWMIVSSLGLVECLELRRVLDAPDESTSRETSRWKPISGVLRRVRVYTLEAWSSASKCCMRCSISRPVAVLRMAGKDIVSMASSLKSRMPFQGPTQGRRSDGNGGWGNSRELHEAVMIEHLTRYDVP